MLSLVAALALLIGLIAGYAIRGIAAKKANDAQKKEQNPFAVVVRPYIREFRKEGWFKEEHELQAGFQYQLFVQGIPCFEPHIIIEKKQHEKKIDPKKTQEALEFAIHAAERAIALNGPALEGVFRLDKRPVSLSKQE